MIMEAEPCCHQPRTSWRHERLGKVKQSTLTSSGEHDRPTPFSTAACYSKMPSLCSCGATIRHELEVTEPSLVPGAPKCPAKVLLQWLHCQVRPSLGLPVGEAEAEPSAQLCVGVLGLCASCLPSLSPHALNSCFHPGQPYHQGITEALV